jgi:hypothetical protein
MNRVFPRMLIPERLALEFLGNFARCEYALKGSGFAKGNAHSVEADWDAFARDVDWHFRRVNDPDFRTAVDFLLSEPPRKQVLRNGHVQWKKAPPDPNMLKAQQVLLMVRRVRNNLFHGAKVWSPEYGNRARDIRLLEAGLVILKHCIRLNTQVHGAYEIGAF